jgi:glutathione S-transferase
MNSKQITDGTGVFAARILGIMQLTVTGSAVRNWRGVHLLHFDASPCSQKVRILLNEKIIAWESHSVDIHKHHHATPWFLSINPRGVVPVLVHDGAVHVESNDIMVYVDKLPSERATFIPRAAEQRAQVMEELAYQSSLRLGTRALTAKFMPLQARHLRNRKALDDYRQNGIPDLSRDMEIAWWQRTADNGIAQETLVESFAEHRDAMRRLDYRLQDREWLYGKRISVLDIAWFTTIHRLKVLGYDLSKHRYLTSYYERLLLRPAFQQELQIKGPLRIIVPAYRLYKRMTGSKLEDLVAD